MKDIHIKLRPDRLNLPLATVFVGRLSSAVFVIEGDVPDDIDYVAVRLGRINDPATGEEREDYSVAAEKITQDGASVHSFRAYASPFNFPDNSELLKYHVVGEDKNDNIRWLGTGSLIVRENPANGSSVAPAIIPADTYVRNPATGLYHKVTAKLTEDNEITLIVSEEGVVK